MAGTGRIDTQTVSRGLTSTLNVINNGTISANVNGQTLTIIGPGGTVTNNGTMQAINGGTLTVGALGAALDNTNGVIRARGMGSVVDLSQTNVRGNIAVPNNGGRIQGANAGKIEADSSVLTDLAISLSSGGSLFADSSTISGGSISEDNSSIHLDNSTLNGNSFSVNSNGRLEFENATISGGSLALSGSSTLLADGGISNIALSIVDPGRLTVTPDAMLQILQDQETGGRTTIDGIMQALNGLTVTRGTLTGTGVIIGNLMLAGVLKPGDSGPGSISIQGNYSQSGSDLLDEELASPSQYNTTDITQSARVGRDSLPSPL